MIGEWNCNQCMSKVSVILDYIPGNWWPHFVFRGWDKKQEPKLLQVIPAFTCSQQPKNKDFHKLITISNFRIQMSLKHLKELEWVTKPLITILIFLRKMHLQDLGSAQIHPGDEAQDRKRKVSIRREEMHISTLKSSSFLSSNSQWKCA